MPEPRFTPDRAAIPTPALVVDVDALDQNIATMAQRARNAGVALRPHAKTHKCAEIARRQIAAGAIGICCAKVAEAEALAAQGIAGLLITSPPVSADALDRVAALNRVSPGLAVVLDHPAVAARLADMLERGEVLDVLIDIDPGIHRTGVTSPAAAVDLAELIAARPTLRLDGVQYYCGLQQHIESYAERQAALIERYALLTRMVAALTAAGHRPARISGGGTGSHEVDIASGMFTELQVGSYVFMDRQYERCQTGPGTASFAQSLTVAATVISANTPGLATLDAGFKALSTDGDLPRVASGPLAHCGFTFMGDEHGALFGFDLDAGPQPGDRVELVPPHCDPTVNLYDRIWAVRGTQVEAVWAIDARGHSW